MRLSFGFLLTLESLKDFPLYLLDIKLIYTQNKRDLNEILIDFLFIFDKSLQMGKVFVHLGSGAGDLDSRQNFRCGFTEFIKKNSNSNDKIFCVEANPFNIEKLKESYVNFRNVEIFNLGISLEKTDQIKFYYTEKDAPHFQVTSIKKEHVERHYPGEQIKNFIIKAIEINDFFRKIDQANIDYLSIDLEGIDLDVLKSIDLEKYNIKNISIEYLHLKKLQKKDLIKYLSKKGYSYCGYGYDHKNFDYLFRKKKIYWNIFISKLFLWIISTKHYKYLNNIIIKK